MDLQESLPEKSLHVLRSILAHSHFHTVSISDQPALNAETSRPHCGEPARLERDAKS
jgi:hypothetical protein